MAYEQAVSVGCVSYLNSKPLIYGLNENPRVKLHLDVPSRLLQGLQTGRYDIALLPVIDYQRMDGLCIVPSSGICCNGPTLTVRIFGRVPVGKIRALACDTHSHSSVALARVTLHHAYGISPSFVSWDAASPQPADTDAALLIGDKVILAEPQGCEHQLDLGEAWKNLTGLPFTFATWVARAGVKLGDLPDVLVQARMDGLAHISEIVRQYAVPNGWPADIATKYLTHYLQFEITPRHIEAIERYHRMAADLALVARPPKPLLMYQDA